MFFSGSKHRHPEHCHEDPMSKHLHTGACDQKIILNIMIKWMFLNIMIKWMWQRLFFNDSQFEGFADHSCCSFLAQPSLPSQDRLVLQQHNQNKQRSLSCSVSIVFRLPISSCWSCPRLLACWPSLMGGACFHNIILSFLPSCETFYNGGDKQKKIFTFRNQKMIDLCLNYSIKFQYPSA